MKTAAGEVEARTSPQRAVCTRGDGSFPQPGRWWARCAATTDVGLSCPGRRDVGDQSNDPGTSRGTVVSKNSR